MRTFLKLIAILITLIALLLLPFALYGFQVGQIIFSPQTMLNLIATEVIGPSQTNIITDTLLESLPAAWGIEDGSPFDQIVDEVIEHTARRTALLPLDLQIEYTAQTLNSLYGWLEGPDPLPVVTLNMVPLKSHLNRNAGTFANDILARMSVCSAEESLALLATVFDAVLSGEAILETMPPCLPAIIPVKTVAPAVDGLLRSQIRLIPETITLDNLVLATPARMQEIKSNLQLMKGLLQWSWMPVLFLLIIAALIGGQTRDGVPFWLGASLIIGSLLTFLITLVPARWWLAVSIPRLIGLPLILQVPAAVVSGPVFTMAAEATLWFAAALLILGVLFTILGFILRRPRPKT
jgi:hypothetical protein